MIYTLMIINGYCKKQILLVGLSGHYYGRHLRNSRSIPVRPHVELIDERDLLWHLAELPHGNGEARQRNLNYDEEDGSASLLCETPGY